jgi:hypothetical protein
MKENWKTINDYPNYEISDLGNVRNIKKGTCMKLITDKNGYKQVHLFNKGKNKMLYVHRLVANAFIPNTLNKPTVNHIDGNTSNNNVNNLEWATMSEQILHSNRVLNNKSIISHKCRELSVKSHRKAVMRDDRKIYEKVIDASIENNVSKTNIQKCCRGERIRAGGHKWQYV